MAYKFISNNKCLYTDNLLAYPRDDNRNKWGCCEGWIHGLAFLARLDYLQLQQQFNRENNDILAKIGVLPLYTSIARFSHSISNYNQDFLFMDIATSRPNESLIIAKCFTSSLILIKVNIDNTSNKIDFKILNYQDKIDEVSLRKSLEIHHINKKQCVKPSNISTIMPTIYMGKIDNPAHQYWNSYCGTLDIIDYLAGDSKGEKCTIKEIIAYPYSDYFPSRTIQNKYNIPCHQTENISEISERSRGVIVMSDSINIRYDSNDLLCDYILSDKNIKLDCTTNSKDLLILIQIKAFTYHKRTRDYL